MFTLVRHDVNWSLGSIDVAVSSDEACIVIIIQVWCRYNIRGHAWHEASQIFGCCDLATTTWCMICLWLLSTDIMMHMTNVVIQRWNYVSWVMHICCGEGIGVLIPVCGLFHVAWTSKPTFTMVHFLDWYSLEQSCRKSCITCPAIWHDWCNIHNLS